MTDGSRLRDGLQYISNHYVTARQEPYAKHKVAQYIRSTAAQLVQLAIETDEFKVKGSAGQGGWAESPWISILHPRITAKTSEGFYAVYLFSADMSSIYLSLNQAVTPHLKSSVAQAKKQLREKADLVRDSIAFSDQPFSLGAIELRSNGRLGQLYEAGNIASRRYDPENLPHEQDLRDDLHKMLRVYLDYMGTLLKGSENAYDFETQPAINSLSSHEGQEEYGHLPADPNHRINVKARLWQDQRTEVLMFLDGAQAELSSLLNDLSMYGDNGGPPISENSLEAIIPQLKKMRTNLDQLIADLETPLPFSRKLRLRLESRLSSIEASLTEREITILKSTGRYLLPGTVKWLVAVVRSGLSND